MAQMRVKDQDLIVEQVVKKIEEIQLDKLKSRDDVLTIQDIVKSRISLITKLAKKHDELEKTIREHTDGVQALVKDFQDEGGFNTSDSHCYSNQGLYLVGCNDYRVSIPELKVAWEMRRSQKREIETKLKLQTMSGDFDVYKLIEELTSEFSS